MSAVLHEQLAFTWPPPIAKPHPLAVLPHATASESPLHAALVADIVHREGAWTIQFRKQVAELLRTLWPGEESTIPTIKPDAYRIDRLDDICFKLTVWEVEVRNELPAGKKDLYAWWWFSLDAMDELLELELRTVDRYGVERVVDLCTAFYEATAGAS